MLATLRFRIPSDPLCRPSGEAVVTLDSRDHYLGRYGNPESRSESDHFIAEWLSNGLWARSKHHSMAAIPKGSSRINRPASATRGLAKHRRPRPR